MWCRGNDGYIETVSNERNLYERYKSEEKLVRDTIEF